MTPLTQIGGPPASRQSLAKRVRAVRQRLVDRAHAASDERARAMGWTVTRTTGQFGMGGRAYRDPRFAALRETRLATQQASARRPA